MDNEQGKHAKEINPGFSRRHFLELLGLGAISTAAAGSLLFSGSYISPNVVKEPSPVFKAGAPEDYEPGSVTLDKEHKVYIVRATEGYFYALSAVCTHLGCITNWKQEEGVVACPCHGSRFDRQGMKIAGPAPRPLQRFGMSLDDSGQLVVDTSVIVGDEVMLKV